MTTYVVRPGDSLYQIAGRFGVSPDSISEANMLDRQPYLVVGQALVIPTEEQAYTVKEGDTVFLIARSFGVSMESIIELNGLSPPYTLSIGRVLRIPERSRNYGVIEVNAYYEATTPQPSQFIGEVGPYLTYISPFSYTINSDGSLNPIDDAAILAAARSNNIAPLMVITNFSGGNFSTPIVDAVLTNPAAQQTLINNVLGVIREKGYYGLNIDFERISPSNREAYNSFLRRVTDAFRPLNIPVSVALAPKDSPATTGAWHGAHDYAAVGNIVDFVILMTYEWGWSGGPPYAVSPINLVEDVIEFAVSVMPADKIMMSLPLYGYDWTLPYVPGGPFARRISPLDAVVRAAERGAGIQYDALTQTPFFNYYDDRGRQHVVWFEDARSAREKLLLINKYGLRGVSFWVLGEEFPQVWLVMDDMFRIVKF
ncbi:MAG: LysM peptidoglycan-binding domain-containing protein [Clostridiales bacterium]|jgi:spore germination protein|nr:LysM peptidoglycan-binding domain-containing protein [Clostridiales bacterium]